MPEQWSFDPLVDSECDIRKIGVQLEIPSRNVYEEYSGAINAQVRAISIRRVIPGSKASMAGLQDGDLIPKVDGTSLVELAQSSKSLIDAFIEYLQVCRTTITLSILRGDKEQLITVKVLSTN
jgi:C-terminal processing protease CtpA/Prc